MVERCSYKKCRGRIIVGQDEILTDEGNLYHYDCYVQYKRNRMIFIEKKNKLGTVTKVEAAEYDDITHLLTGMEKCKEVLDRDRLRHTLEGCKSLQGPYFSDDESGTPIMLDVSVSLKLPARKSLPARQLVAESKKLKNKINTGERMFKKIEPLVNQVINILGPETQTNPERGWQELKRIIDAQNDTELISFFEFCYAQAHGPIKQNVVKAITEEEKKAIGGKSSG